MDFYTVTAKNGPKGVVEIRPDFDTRKSKNLMIRGGDFYAVYTGDGLWSTDEQFVIDLIDKDLTDFAAKYAEEHPMATLSVKYLRRSSSKMIDEWHHYCQKQRRDSFHNLDEVVLFNNSNIKREDYASKCLPYPLLEGDTSAWDELLGTLYDPEERHKIEWAIGSIVNGDSKHIQKFLVFYGGAGTGKSTVLNVIEQLFEGYTCVFDAKALGSDKTPFGLEAFKDNPLVGIQHDGDLSKIEDNTKINSLVSHEKMMVNPKYGKQYPQHFNAFLFMGTNRPVKITDAKSGILRRLIDVSPTGVTVPFNAYRKLTRQIKFELGAIAYKCKQVYEDDPNYYDDYVPIKMMGASNDFYNFVEDNIINFKDGVSLNRAWSVYKQWVEDSKIPYPFSKRVFKEELKNYFDEFLDRYQDEESGERMRSYYKGFRMDKIDGKLSKNGKKFVAHDSWIKMIEQPSVFDALYSLCEAQIAGSNDKPTKKWADVKTELKDLDTSLVHYVKVPKNHIVIDFDIKNEKGEKDYERNLEAASKWPPTYAELSKGGAGIHLHYIWDGDVTKLSRIYDDDIEIKTFTGNASLRRRLSKCNNSQITHLNSGLPLKEERKKMVDEQKIKSDIALHNLIKRNLNKEIHPGTKPSMDFIKKILDDAYESGLSYDVSDMRDIITAFAAHSSNHAKECLKMIDTLKWCSADKDKELQDLIEDIKDQASIYNDMPVTIYDIEVFPNLLLIKYKEVGEGKPIKKFVKFVACEEDNPESEKTKAFVKKINSPLSVIEEIITLKLVGFNCRRYDNHITYAAYMGYTNAQLYKLSAAIIAGKGNQFFDKAYNISYTDIYDYAAKKQSLKKWEIELGIHHQELGLPWDKPVRIADLEKVIDYCDNDVIATEAVWNATKGDFAAREILADLAHGSVNDTTNQLTTKIVFGGNRKPQDQFCYRNLALPVYQLSKSVADFLKEKFPAMMTAKHGPENSLLPYFPGYEFKEGKSTYRGEEVSEGGYVYAEPGIHTEVGLMDVVSMHPHSAMLECLFGPEFTRRFYDIVYGRVNIKHEAWDVLDKMLDGALKPYIKKVKDGEMSSKALAQALKIAINSVYGLTAAGFDNPFKDKRNIDNIVAKRGALFMIDLKYAVQEKGFTVAHIKTDSIKIPNATPEIIAFVHDFGKRYGYTFEHEATYEKMCLVNDAVYVAKYADKDWCQNAYGYIPGDNKDEGGHWTATGTQFAVPYVFKTLFSHEPITFEDKCETKSVSTAMYLDFNENLTDVSQAEKDLEKYTKQFKKGEMEEILYERLRDKCLAEIEQGHDYIFVGRVGQFCPVYEGSGGGILVREKDGKFYSVTGTKGYRWLESEYVRKNHLEGIVDERYYRNLVDEACDTISKYGDLDDFLYVSEEGLPFE